MDKVYKTIPCLSLIESHIYVLDYDKQYLDAYLYHINEIVERTESQVLINIVFKDISVKFSIYEDVFINIYLGLLQMNSRFLNDKTVIVLFPQLDDRKFNVDENSFYISNNDNSNNYPNFIRIEDTISIQRDHSYSITESKNRDRIINEYNHVCVGGSFDHFHIGHYVNCVNSDSFVYLNYVSQKIFDYRINFRSDDWKEEWS